MFLKRIFSVISETIFYMFLERAKAEGLKMGAALAVLAEAYARGRIDIKKWPDLIKQAQEEAENRKKLAEEEAKYQEKILNEALDPNQ